MIRRLFRRKLPDPPRNVQIVLSDGTRIPMDLAYGGRDRHGHHIWVNAYPIELHGRGFRELSVDYLPPKTGIDIDGKL